MSDIKLTKMLFDDFKKMDVKETDTLVVYGHKEWDEVQKLCRKQQKVIALEITDKFRESCARVRKLFDSLASEFPGICVRVYTGPFPPLLSLDKIFSDVGPVGELPAILLLYYDDPDHLKRKTYAGETVIRKAIEDGQLKTRLKAFIDERLQHRGKLTDSMKESDMMYKSELDKISRQLSKDELVAKGKLPNKTSAAPTPSTIPEEVRIDNESTTKNDSVSGKDDVDTSSLEIKKGPCRPTSASSLEARYIIKKDEIEIQEKIGQGGFGTVFKAKWGSKKVAVKSCEGNLLELGPAEVKILASLPPHPNVVTFFGVALSDDKISSLIVTELAFDGSLLDALHSKNSQEPTAEKSLAWSAQIANGMEHLHQHNIIHRDLKSPNVLLSLGNAKICDFGTARELSKTCRPTGIAGTYRWMAPEIATEIEHVVNNKCDVYSYGMILYEIYAVRIPFVEISSDLMVCFAVMQGKRPPIPPKLPSFLNPVIRDCWKQDPVERPTFRQIVMTFKTESYEKYDN